MGASFLERKKNMKIHLYKISQNNSPQLCQHRQVSSLLYVALKTLNTKIMPTNKLKLALTHRPK